MKLCLKENIKKTRVVCLLIMHLLLCSYEWEDVLDKSKYKLLEETRKNDETKLLSKIGEDALKLSALYFYEKEDKRNYHNGLYWQRVASSAGGSPMYAWGLQSKNDINWVYVHNGEFNETAFKVEGGMLIALLNYDSEWLFNRAMLSINNTHEEMLNEEGSASKEYCGLTPENKMIFLAIPSVSSNKGVVVDIGSGWGACSKQLALLGYKVYSIDKDKRHIQFQKDDFCRMPGEYTFLHKYWELTGSEYINNESAFKEYCETIKKQNIKFITGNFTDPKTIEQIQDTRWSVVVALNSMHFMNDKEKEMTSNMIDKHLDKEGVFFLKANQKKDSSTPYNFKVKDLFLKYFSKYNILTYNGDPKGDSASITIYKSKM